MNSSISTPAVPTSTGTPSPTPISPEANPTPAPTATAPSQADNVTPAAPHHLSPPSLTKPTVSPVTATPVPSAATSDTPIVEAPATPSPDVTAYLLKTVAHGNNNVKSSKKSGSTSFKMGHRTRKVILWVSSFFCPPLAVYLRRGSRHDLGLNILLTILGWIPGVLHAMYHISK
ncbi:hypothetical protein B0J18DRAFT_417298 [Chaetomium sp. MPI-SDFR-AT-0129]|nr:hypothetical protein B0J18DRAFT_417298 [Chaetomium sp. MPI-SDFR-AT-0129]